MAMDVPSREMNLHSRQIIENGKMDFSGPYNPTEIQYYLIPSFLFKAGSSLPVRIAYRIFNPEKPRTVCLPTSEHGHINTTNNFASGSLKDYRVVVVATFGNGESSSPSNTPDFPQPLYEDCIKAYYDLFRNYLKVDKLEAVVGFGMGGQQAFYWMCMFPDFVKSAVVICGPAKTSSYNVMLLEGVATALKSSAGYSLAASRAQNTDTVPGLHSYGRVTCAGSTSHAWFRDELFRTELGFENIHQFMDEYNSSFNAWHAADLLALVRMWQLGDIGALSKEKSVTAALEEIQGRVLLIASSTDYYFSSHEAAIEASYLQYGTLEILETVWGHAAGSGLSREDNTRLDELIEKFLNGSQ